MKRRLRDDPFVKLVRKHGWLEVQRAMSHAVGWAWLSVKLEREPTITEYVEYWCLSRSACYREQEAFRRITGLDSPTPLVESATAAGHVFDAEERPAPLDGVAMLPYFVPYV